MSIVLKISDPDKEDAISTPPAPSEEEKIVVKITDEPTLAQKAKDLQNPITVKMDIRRTISGDLMVLDHRLINIYVKTSEHKVITMPKEEYTEVTYGCQRDFFDYLVNKGIIDREDIEGGTVYGSLQAVYKDITNPNQSTLQVVLFAIHKWCEKERPAQQFNLELFKKNLDALTNPDEADSTDPEKIAKMEKEYGIDQRMGRHIYNTNNIFPYGGLGYYFEE